MDSLRALAEQFDQLAVDIVDFAPPISDVHRTRLQDSASTISNQHSAKHDFLNPRRRGDVLLQQFFVTADD